MQTATKKGFLVNYKYRISEMKTFLTASAIIYAVYIIIIHFITLSLPDRTNAMSALLKAADLIVPLILYFSAIGIGMDSFITSTLNGCSRRTSMTAELVSAVTFGAAATAFSLAAKSICCVVLDTEVYRITDIFPDSGSSYKTGKMILFFLTAHIAVYMLGIMMVGIYLRKELLFVILNTMGFSFFLFLSAMVNLMGSIVKVTEAFALIAVILAVASWLIIRRMPITSAYPQVSNRK